MADGLVLRNNYNEENNLHDSVYDPCNYHKSVIPKISRNHVIQYVNENINWDYVKLRIWVVVFVIVLVRAGIPIHITLGG